MEQTMEREIFSFSENSKEIVNTTKPFSFRHDCQFLICCRETIYMFTLTSDLDIRSHSFSHKLPCKMLTQELIVLSDLPSSHLTKGIINTSKTVKNLPSKERMDFLTDSTLYPSHLFPKADSGGFRQAIFSPPSQNANESFIVAITFDHQVFIFKDFFGQWKLLCEFTEVLKNQIMSSIDLPLPITVQADNMALNEYRDLIHSMSCVQILWSKPFQCFDSDGTSYQILLLFCGMRDGQVHIWKMKTCHCEGTLQDAFFHLAMDKYPSEVTSLCWHSTTSDCGLLSVGYLDGSLRVLSITSSSNSSTKFEVTKHYERLSKDHMSVFDMATTEIDPNVHILVACRQYFIDIYRIQENNQIKFVKSIHIDCSLPLESISLRGRLGSTSCQDGAFFYLLFYLKCDDINIQCTKSKVTCLPNGTETIWSCKGTMLSLNGALCFSLYRPFTDFFLKGQVNSRFMNRQRLVVSFMPSFSIDNFAFPTTCNSPILYTSTLDVTIRLLLVLQDIFRKNDSLGTMEELLDRLIVSERLENLQIARAVYFFEFFKIQRSSLPSQALTLSSETKSEELGEMILCRHISNMVHSAGGDKSVVFDKLPFICTWINASQRRCISLSKLLDIDEENLKLLQGTESHKYLCCFCGAKLTSFEDMLKIKCANQHMNELCCLTLSPIADTNPRHCFSCNASAKGTSEIAKVDISLIQNVHQCTLCGGRLQ